MAVRCCRRCGVAGGAALQAVSECPCCRSAKLVFCQVMNGNDIQHGLMGNESDQKLSPSKLSRLKHIPACKSVFYFMRVTEELALLKIYN